MFLWITYLFLTQGILLDVSAREWNGEMDYFSSRLKLYLHFTGNATISKVVGNCVTNLIRQGFTISCEDCKTLKYQIGTDAPTRITCSSEQFCGPGDGAVTCIDADSPDASECSCGEEENTSIPDPYDPTMYYSCLPGGDQVGHFCAADQIFTGDNNEPCADAPTCYDDNTGFNKYTCKRSFSCEKARATPIISTCEAGTVWDEANFRCVDPCSLAPAIFSCDGKENGANPDPSDCSKYHLCFGSIHYPLECADSIPYFNTEDKVCVATDSGNCPTTDPCYEEYKNTCSDTTMTTAISTTGTDITESTTDSTELSTTTAKTTTKLSESTTKSTTYTTTTESSTSTTDSTESSTTSDTTPESSMSTIDLTDSSSTSDSESAIPDCSKVNGVSYFPKEGSCKEFYSCESVGGFALNEYTCPNDQLYDPVNNYCNLPNLVPSCQAGSSTVPPSSPDSKTQTQTPDLPKNSDTGPSIIDCGKVTSQTYFPKEGTCIEFYSCESDSNGGFAQKEYSCPGDLVFDPVKQHCNLLDLVPSCQAGQSTVPPSPTDPITSKQTPDSSKISDTGSSTIDCGKVTSPTYFPKDETCKGFYSCESDGKGSFHQKEYSCPGDLVYDPVNQYCNLLDLVPSCQAGPSRSRSIIVDCGKVTSPTYFPKKGTCKQFYSCESNNNGGFAQKEYSCPGDLVYDPFNQYCNLLDLVPSCLTGSQTVPPKPTDSVTTTKPSDLSKNSDTGSTTIDCSKVTSPTYFPKKDTCKEFYSCESDDKGGFVLKKYGCPGDLVYDPVNQYCNLLDLVPSCQAGPPKVPLSPTAVPPSPTTATSSPTTFPPTPTDSKTPTQAPDLSLNSDSGSSTIDCGKVTSQTNFPKDETCKEYYSCESVGGFILKENSCPGDLVYDPVNQHCNLPNLVPSCQAGSTTVPPSSTELITSTQTTKTPDSPSTTQTPDSSTYNTGSTIIACSNDTPKTYFPKKELCQEFYSCESDGNFGSALKDNSCPGDLVYIPVNQYCDLLDFVPSCQAGLLPVPPSLTESITSTKAPDSSKISDTGSTIIDCSKVTSPTYFLNEETCKKFYSCEPDNNGGFAQKEYSCPGDLVYDPVNQYCNLLSLVPSCQAGSSRSGSIMMDCDKVTSPTYFPKVGTCKEFYSCESDDKGGFVQKKYSCPGDLVYDPVNQYCNLLDLVPSCQAGPPTVPPSPTELITSTQTLDLSLFSNTGSIIIDCGKVTSPTYFPKEGTCKGFYSCESDDKGGFALKEYNCPGDLVYDPVNQYCNLLDLVPSCQAGPSTIPPSSTDSVTSTQTLDSSSASDTGSKIINCDKATSQIYFPKEETCKEFYSCESNSNGGTSLKDNSCPGDLVYIPVNQYCNLLDFVHSCQAGPSTIPSSPTESITSTQTLDFSLSSDTGSKIIDCGKVTSQTYFPKEKTCKEFYSCESDDNGGFTQKEYSCPGDLVYDPGNQYCNLLDLVPSCQAGTSTVPSSPTESITSTETPDSSKISDTGSTIIDCGKVASPTYFPKEETCKEFYSCESDGNGGFALKEYSCPGPLVYDPVNEYCNLLSLVPSCQ